LPRENSVEAIERGKRQIQSQPNRETRVCPGNHKKDTFRLSDTFTAGESRELDGNCLKMWKTEQQPDLSLLIPDTDPCPPPPAPPCSCCTRPDSHHTTSLPWKLVCLLTIALAALASILVISHQLIARHMAGAQHREGVTLSLNIPDSGWMSDTGLHQALRYPGYEESGYHVEVQPLETEDSEESLAQSAYHLSTLLQGEEQKIHFHSPLTLENTAGESLVEDGMYWSQQVEDVIKPGVSGEKVEQELTALRKKKVVGLDTPTWLRCGREQNRAVRFDDGTEGCARYREPHTQLVLGELISFYLARLLGIHNVPATVLSQVDPNNPVWAGAVGDIESAGWRLGSVVTLTGWQTGLVRTGIPSVLRQALLARTTLDVTSDMETYSDLGKDLGKVTLRDLTLKEAGEVAQWSDLVVFDYLTGNYDRVSSMQDAAEKEGRPELLAETVHNLAKNSVTGKLWLLDNESGMLDSYSLLYPRSNMGHMAEREGQRFRSMQRDLLQSTCIFRRQTVDRVFQLYRAGDTAMLLNTFVGRKEPLYRELLAGLREQEQVLREHLDERVGEVWEWMKQCQEGVRFW